MTTDVMLMKVTLNFFGGSGSIQVRERKGGRKRSKFGELPNRVRLLKKTLDQSQYPRNFAPTPPLTKHLSRYQLSVVESGKKKVGNCSATNNDPKRFKMVFRATSFFFVISRRL